MSYLATINARGVVASRPAAAAANEGYNYYATDLGVLYRSNGSSWDVNSSGFTNPMTTAGDLIVGGASGAPTRLAGSGTDGWVATYDSTATPKVKWAAAAGGGGATIAYPTLKPGSPSDDFAAALSGWTAVSNAGTWVIGNCLAQAIDGSHLFMGYNNVQSGFMYKAATDVDQELIVGGLMTSTRWADQFAGIALLDTSNNGVGLIYHSGDNTIAIIAIAAGVYTGSPAAVLLSGTAGTTIGTPTRIWLRLIRIGNTWGGYYSFTGAAWDTGVPGGATMTRAVTVARKGIGLFNATAGAMQLTADYLHTV